MTMMSVFEAVETIEEFYNSCHFRSTSEILTPDGVKLQTDWGYFEEGIAEIKRYAMGREVSEPIRVDKPTDKQIKYAGYLAHRMCVPLPTVFTKAAYSEFIRTMKPIVKAEDDAMNEPGPWGMAYL